MEKFLQYLQEAEKTIRTSDHMLYMTYPLVKDKNVLLKILCETKTAITNCINAILQHEYLYKRISLYKDPKENFRTFENKCSRPYNITKEEINLILELFELAKKHKESSMEFIKDEKVVILSNNSEPKTFTVEKAKQFLELAKNILKKTKERIKKS